MDEDEEATLSEAEMTEEEEEDGDGSQVISAMHLDTPRADSSATWRTGM